MFNYNNFNLIIKAKWKKICLGLTILTIFAGLYFYQNFSYNNLYENISTNEIQNKLGVPQKNVNRTRAEKWIIVTTINEPTEQIKRLAAIRDFQLLVIGDKKTKQHWFHENTIFLSLKEQSSLGYKILENTPFNAYNRKNIGKFTFHSF